MSTGFNLKSPPELAPNKRVSLSFKVLKPSIDFSSLAMKIIDDIFFQYKAILPTLKYYYLACMCTCSVALFVTQWTLAYQAPLSWDFSGKDTGLPFPPPGDRPDSGIELTSPVSPTLAGRFFTILSQLGNPLLSIDNCFNYLS